MTRLYNSIRNTKYAVIGQVAGILISFLSRIIFVNTLSSEYLGLNGLFSNLLSMLSFAELGIGSAIIYSLYKPLAENNAPKIKALMKLYKKAYISIGIIIGVLGVAITPFLSFLIKDIPNIPYISLIYLMFVINSSISYFFSYKRSLIIADQKRYITTIYRYGWYVILNIFQIIVLLLTHNFIIFLAIQILCTFLENIFVSRKANKMYSYIKGGNTEELDIETKDTIIRNVKAMMCHKIGSIVVNGTDNILLSKFIGVVIVGLYSNYILIINAMNAVVDMIFQAVTASIGNLGVSESNERMHFIFKCLNLIGFWVYGLFFICLINLFNPFIKLWVGEEYLLPMPLVLIIIFNLYLNGMRKSVITFKDALGLYWYDRYKPLFESIVNLFVSILLATKLGAVGIFLGTAISTITTCFWIEPYVLYKHGLNINTKSYFSTYFIYTSIMLFTGGLTWSMCSFIGGESIASFVIKLIICVLITNGIFALFFWRTKEFRYLFDIIKKIRSPFLKMKVD